jgi:hypothetical protein
VFALAIPARALLMCMSLHLLGGRYGGGMIFGPYFLVPFGLALSVLLLEAGLVSGRRGALAAALAAPLGLIALALVGHREDVIYQQFRDTFTSRLGGTPLFLTLLLCMAYYLYASWRGVTLAVEALSVTLAALSFVGPEPLTLGSIRIPPIVPLLVAAALQLGLGMWRRSSWRCLVGTTGLIAVAALDMPQGGNVSTVYLAFLYHLVLLSVLIIGGFCDGLLARGLRDTGAGMVLVACSITMGDLLSVSETISPTLVAAYAPLMGLMLASYGWGLSHRPSMACASMVLTCWLTATLWAGYHALRLLIAGLDYIVLSLALFAAAIVVSLAKSGRLNRWRPGVVGGERQEN